MPKPLYQKIYLKENKSFNILKVERPYFAVPWHFHPEIEIMLVVKGRGTRFVGDSIGNFEPLDLVMVGSNLAHVWKNSHEHYEENAKLVAEARVILFREDCFGKDFFKIPEMTSIQALLLKAERGIKFDGKTRLSISNKILKSFHQSPTEQLICFLEILNELATSEEYSFLSSPGYQPKVHSYELERLNLVLDYLMKNYREEVKLDDVADIANMSTTAFCRYFKSRTNKTIIQFLNELRIGYAHKLLLETQLNIVQICYECGFKNVSNFYQQFQKITKKSPFQFRKAHRTRDLM